MHSSLHTETIPEEPEHEQTAEEPTQTEDIIVADNPEQRVQCLYSKQDQNAQMCSDGIRAKRINPPAECVSPDSTSQCVQDIRCKTVEVVLSQGTENDQTTCRKGRTRRKKKDNILPDTTSCLEKPRTRSQVNAKNDVTCSQEVLEIPETQPTASALSDSKLQSCVELNEISQQLIINTSAKIAGDPHPLTMFGSPPMSPIDDAQQILQEDNTLQCVNIKQHQHSNKLTEHNDLEDAPLFKDNVPNWSDDQEYELLIEESCSARPDCGEMIDLAGKTDSPKSCSSKNINGKQCSLLKCSQEFQVAKQQKQPERHGKKSNQSVQNTIVSTCKPQKGLKTPQRQKHQETCFDKVKELHCQSTIIANDQAMSTKKETPAKFFKSRLLQFEKHKDKNNDECTVYEFEPDLDLSQISNDKKRQRVRKNAKKPTITTQSESAQVCLYYIQKYNLNIKK
jgi:hypothetical protein